MREGRVTGVRDKKQNGGERGARWRKVNGVGKQDPTRGKEGERDYKKKKEG